MKSKNRRLLFVLISSGFLLSPLVGGADDKPDVQAKAAIRKVLDDQVAAWNKGDLEAFMAGYWKSPKLSFSSGNNKVEGWQATLTATSRRYQSEGREMGKLSFTDLQIEPLGLDSAFVRGRFHLKTSKDNPTGIFTLIFRKLPEGWRIVHDHTSS